MGTNDPRGCAEVAELGSDYLDGVLSAHERRRIEVHLEQCEHCRAQIERLRETIRLVRALRDVELPEEITAAPEQARRRAEAESQRRPRADSGTVASDQGGSDGTLNDPVGEARV